MAATPRGVCPFCGRERSLRWEGDRWTLRRHVGVESVVCDGTGEEPDPLPGGDAA
jgi:hypothetical protein